ncbi:uncharacterized protein BX664DRAFT_381623 [Halteromyces radiatus]|uniref:uncharacterized protein n=1 Tax=Halteromyces radiatus TaxID=101107 RepID=UPI00221FC499|nr:uncharacterized protein BX664DRAFT_381623 [Halteromyces radiatus]KAI8098995.1 hypothetical protein BX664DRAFT_381623 [Halteromyces radiatus]
MDLNQDTITLDNYTKFDPITFNLHTVLGNEVISTVSRLLLSCLPVCLLILYHFFCHVLNKYTLGRGGYLRRLLRNDVPTQTLRTLVRKVKRVIIGNDGDHLFQGLYCISDNTPDSTNVDSNSVNLSIDTLSNNEWTKEENKNIHDHPFLTPKSSYQIAPEDQEELMHLFHHTWTLLA